MVLSVIVSMELIECSQSDLPSPQKDADPKMDAFRCMFCPIAERPNQALQHRCISGNTLFENSFKTIANVTFKSSHLQVLRRNWSPENILGKHAMEWFQNSFLVKLKWKVCNWTKKDSNTNILPRIFVDPYVSESQILIQIKA